MRGRPSWIGLLGGALLACGPGSVGVEAGDDSTGGEPSETAGPNETETGTETGIGEAETGDSETDTGSGTDETETGEPEETGTGEPEPDLPPAPRCADWDTKPGFEQVCFEPPLIVDPTPVSVLARAPGDVLRVYAGGVDTHRLYELAELTEGGEGVELAMLGAAVAARSVPGLFGDGIAPFVILTRDPDAVVVHDLGDPEGITILTEVELPAEPTAFSPFPAEFGGSPVGLAVADVAGDLHLFIAEMQELAWIGARALPEPLDALDLLPPWFAWEYGNSLLGRSSASQTAWHLGLPITVDGPIAGYPLPVPVDAWHFLTLTDVGPDAVFVASEALGEARNLNLLELDQVGPSVPLAHPVAELDYGPVPLNAFGGIYGLSTVDARLTLIGVAGGEAWDFDPPPANWLEVPPDTVDFLALGKTGFVCASASEGLALLAPVSP